MTNEALREEANVAAEQSRRDAEAARNLLRQEQERLAEETAAHGNVEEELCALRRELDEARAGREEARANLGVVAAACREAEAKSRELQEHRKVLAREVKSSRAEQRRLSAALACATTAATAAAATVAATSVASGNRDRSSSGVSWAGGDAPRTCKRREGGVEERSGEVLEEVGGEMPRAEEGRTCSSEPSTSGDDSETAKEKPSETGETPAFDRLQGSLQHASVDFSSDGLDPLARVCDGEAVTASPWLRPSSLDDPGASMKAKERAGGESGATSPEAGSPGLSTRTDGGEQHLTSLWNSLSLSSRNPVDPSAVEARPLVAEDTPNCTSVGVHDSGGGGSASSKTMESAECGGEEAVLAQSLRLGMGAGLCGQAGVSGSSAELASSSAAAVAAESSRLNQMMQSFSSGLRESRRARRTPLLGSLDCDGDSDDLETDDGGVTDGTDGDSRHDATRGRGDRGGWSTWSTVGGSSHGLVAKEQGGSVPTEAGSVDETCRRDADKVNVFGGASDDSAVLPASSDGDGAGNSNCCGR